MAKFRVETQLAIDKASAQGAKVAMEGITKAATQLAGVLVGEKAFVAPFKALKSVIEDSIAASEKATAAQERMGQAMKNVYKTIGDEMTPGLNQLAESIQQALSNPEIIAGLKTTGQLLSVMATGISAVVDEIAGFVGSPAFAKWLQILYGVDLNTDAMKAYREQGAAVDAITAAVSKWAKGVQEQQKAEEKAAEARKKAHETHLKDLQSILDRADPLAKAEREAWQQILTLNQAMKAGEIDVATYQDALALVTAELNAIKAAGDLVAQTIETLPVNRTIQLPEERPQGGTMTIEQIETAASRYADAMDGAAKQFSSTLEQGATSAIASAMSEFLHTGEMNIKALGQMLLDTLLNAAAEYFAQMVVNQAKLKMSSGVQGTNGTSGTSSAMGALGNVALAAAVVYAVVEITKGIKAANDAGKFKETAAAGVYRGGVGSTYAGELSAQGRQMADALRGFLNLMQSVAGSWITSMGEIGVRVSGDGKKFQAMVGGEIIGTFKSMSEAMVRAFQAAFKDATFASEIDPIIREMVTNFRGTDIEELKKGLVQVKQMLNEVSGLSDIEIAIKDLPFQADALKQSMVQLGASFEEASSLAARWQATQMGNLRDQITGHQATEAEQRAQKEREALLFNAQLALNKAEITMKRDKLAADIEILKAGGSIALADLNFTTQYMGQIGRLTEVKAELLNQDIQIQQGHVNLMTAAGQAALASLQLQLDALNQVYAILDSIKPINLAEIRIPHSGGSHGGSINTGPTPEEIAAQLAADIASFWEDIAAGWRSAMGGLSSQLAELNHWYEEQAARARELGIPLEELNALYQQQLTNLANDTLASLGLQSLATIQQFENLTEALKYLRDWGTITEAQIRELGDSMYLSLVDGLLQYVDNEDVRRQLEDLRFRMEIANYQLQFQYLQSLGLLTQAEIDVINGLFTDIQAAYDAGALHFQQPSVNQTQSNGSNAADEARSRAEQALREALDRLRSAVETLTQWQKGLTLSASSPLTTNQQYQEAQRQYMALLAAAQGGDIDAMAQLAEAAQTYLDLAAEMFGTSGAGYAAIFDAVSQQVAAIAAMGQQILDSVPPQMAGTEDRLDTIADILRVMAGLGAGGTGTGGANSHAGLVYYGPDWGWHPMGWSPGGNTPPGTGNLTASLGSAGNLSLGNFSQPGAVTVRAPDLLAKIDQLVTAHQTATIEAKNDRMKKTAPSLSGYHGQPIGSRRSA